MTRLTVFSLLIILLTAAVPLLASAEPYRRQVETEWEEIPGAKSYEIELKLGKLVIHKKVTKPAWQGRLIPGVYEMRLRAKDIRGVPGDWSPPEPFKVGLESPKVQAPSPEKPMATNEESNATVPFQWPAVGGANRYVLDVRSQDGTLVKHEETKSTKTSVKLPVAQIYSWSIKAIGPNGESDAPAAGSFQLQGKRLSPVSIEKPENEFVRGLKWSSSDNASSYQYVIERYEPKTKTWDKVHQDDDCKTTEIAFDPQWPGGKYRVTTVAKGNLRPNSQAHRVTFNVRTGDRSPAAEEVATIRQSIERLTGWYTIASYLLTVLDYQGVNFDRSNSRLHYSAIGGTGRVGAGYFSKSSPWGFLGIMDMSGLSVQGGGTFTYASLEGNMTYRQSIGDRGEIRHQMGLFYKELPETVGPSSTNITETNNIKTVGPHYGLEYWYAVTPKMGFQLNAHLYPNLMKMKTTNDQNISPSLSYQLGVLGSYRLRHNLTGLAGYAYRLDRADYLAQEGQGSARAGDLNSVQMTGHYINFFLEWAL